jgi:hypothetical protein
MRISEDKMSQKNAITLLTIPISGIVAFLALLIRGPFTLPIQGSTDWILTVGSFFYLPMQILIMISYVLPFFGFVSIYILLSHDKNVEFISYIGLVFSLIGTALAISALGILTFVSPAIINNVAKINTTGNQILLNSLMGPGLIISLLAAIFYTTGPILLGIAIWKSRIKLRIAGILFSLHGISLSIGFTIFPILLIGWLLLSVSGLWIYIDVINRKNE